MLIQQKFWPHAPPHKTQMPGTYMVMASTYRKDLLFKGSDRMLFLHDTLLDLAKQYDWSMQAWAVFPNHYHFIAQSSMDPQSLSVFIRHLHATTSKYVNDLDRLPGRQVWFQFRDTHLTYPHSYFARLNYVIQNPVRHKIVAVAEDYPWCSARWFANVASKSFCETVSRFKTDRLNIPDDF